MRDRGPGSTRRSSVIWVAHSTRPYAFRRRICSNPGDRRGGTMEYTHLGRLGSLVSRFCLGTMNFGPETSEEDSHAIMDRALELGINFFDTANVYGWGENRGRTERIIGNWFARRGGRRDKVVLATKLYGSM